MVGVGNGDCGCGQYMSDDNCYEYLAFIGVNGGSS